MSAPRLKKDPKTGTYYIHWCEGARSKRVSTSERDSGKAQIFLANWMMVKNTGSAELPSEFRVRDLWETYRTKHEVASTGTRDYIWKNLEQHFGDLIVTDVNDSTAEDYGAKRAKGSIGRRARPATIRRELAALLACFNWCAHRKRKLIPVAHVPQFDLPPDGEPRDRWLRKDEVQKLLDVAAKRRVGPRLSRIERFLWIALETGARKKAIFELTWDRVDFETGVIHYDVPGRKKTKKKRAAPPISKALRPVLERAFTERKTDFVLDHAGEIKKSVTRLGAEAEVPGVTPHVLRHTAATHMARNGVPLWKIAGILGNSIAMIEKVYAKHCPDGLRDAVDQISGGVLEPAE